MRIETIDLRTITEADAQAIATLFVAIWPKPGRTVETMASSLLTQWREYRGPDAEHPRAVMIREDDRVIAHAAAYPRVVETTAGEMTFMALARVCTDPAVRGRKLGQTVTKAAFKLVDDGLFPFALFQTNEQVAPFYERLGAAAVNNEFINSTADDPAFSPFWDRIIMRYPATGNWPAGQIDLRGPGW